MSNEELILEIIEKVHDDVKDTNKKVDILQIEQVRQSEMHRINTKSLDEHMRRTEANEKRLKVVEGYLAFINTAIKLTASVGGIILFFVAVIPFVKDHLLR